MAKFKSTKRARLLRSMLEAWIEDRKTKAEERRKAVAEGREEKPPMKLYSFSEMTVLALNPTPEWVERMERAAKDGAGESLEASIREEGWRAFSVGGLPAMHELADAACSTSSMEALVSMLWDGIGGEYPNNCWVQ